MIKLFIKICLASIVVVFFHAPPVLAKDHLTLWIHPYLPAAKLMAKFSPLVEYLSQECDLTIDVRISKSYDAHIDNVGKGRVDFAYMGPAPYARMTQRYGQKQLLAVLEVNGKPFYSGMIIVRKGSAIKKLEDLRGKKFAFGNPKSTMSHLVPHFMLRQAGVVDAELEGVAFLGSHSNVALGVLGGYYDAGGVKEAIFYQYEGRGLALLAQSEPIGEHLFLASNTLPQAIIKKLRRALVALKDQGVLGSIKKSATGMGLVHDENYDSLRQVLQQCDKYDARE